MTILQVAGEDESFGVLNGSIDVGVNGRRAAYTRCSIHSNTEDGVQIIFREALKAYLDAQPAGDKDFWFGYRFAGGGGFTTNGIGMKLYDSTDKCFMRLFGFGTASLGLQLSSNGSFAGGAPTLYSYPASDTAQIAPAGNPHEWTFRVKIHPTLGHVAWYVNGVFWFQTPLMDTTVLCSGSPKFIRLGVPNSNGNSNYSEFIATSADDPRVGKSLCTLAPTADGLTGWPGGVASISETTKDTSTQVSTGVAASDVTFVVSDIPALTGSIVVLALVVSGEYAAAPTAPQHLNQVLRIGGTIYPGALKTVNSVIDLLQTIWETSPATSSTITETEVNSVEIGMRSAA